ncbi:phage tail tape measure protein [Vagococcus fessus]|uniref:Phage tail tape measure protein n=1 Tax=Vagococcus fessus TaxID=120370 RepID=A0A430A580_9ENTE|nr:phage tail tape measure protein [Vagococcus fessus]RSU01968.1 phage tail tape measure protein [Vagococcus fessus]
MSGKLGDIAATVSLDIDPFVQSTRVLQAQTKGINSSLRAQEMAVKNSGKSINGLKGIYNTTAQAMKVQSELTDKLKNQYERYKESIGDVNNASEKEIKTLMNKEKAYLDSAGKLEQITGKYNALGKEIAVQESKFTKMGDSLQNLGDKVTKAGDGMTSFGNKMSVGVTAPIVAGAGIAIKAASDYESAFAGVRKTVNASDAEFEKLSTGIRNMAKEMPASAVEIANVAEAAGQLGVSTPDILSFSETMIKMGVATNMSAEESSVAIARFANIMDMPMDKVDRLGSSVVELGNNFATTESEVVQMGLRLSGVGKQIGLSESDVMGLAAAMSSVGIEAEAGGTAMSTALKKMQNAVAVFLTADEDLEKARKSMNDKDFKKFEKEVASMTDKTASFAKVAGVSSKEFANLFKDDPSKALQKYVEGLGKASENGENLNNILDDVGIKGIRESDTFLRLAGNSKLLGEALDSSGKAWDENSALANEAEQRYETLESKLSMLKNQLSDVAIEFGGPLVDAMKDGIEAAEPMIKVGADIAKSFSNASPETQQMIIKMGLLAGAVGPVSSISGKFISILGGGIGTIGKFSKIIGGMAKPVDIAGKALDGGSSSFGVYAKGGEKATGGIAKFGKAVLGINPWVAGAGLALGAGVLAWELWGKGAVESAKRTSKWGTDVGETTDKTLTKLKKLTDDGKTAIDDLANGVDGSSKKISESFKSMGEEMAEGVEKGYQESLDKIKDLPDEIQKGLKKDIDNKKKHDDEIIKSTNELSDKVLKITESKNAKQGKLSEDQKNILLQYQREMNEKEVELMNVSSEEKKTILAALNGDIKDMNEKQLKVASQELHDSLSQELTSYKEHNEKLKELFESGKISEEAYKEQSKALEAMHKTVTDNMVNNLIRIKQEQGKSDEFIIASIESLGISYEKAKEYVKGYSDTVEKSSSIVAKSSNDMGESALKATESWNNIILDDKTGDIKTNLPEFLGDLIKSKDGWEQIKFITKNADLTSNAKEMIFNAISESGKWNDLKLDKKILKAENTSLLIELTETEGAIAQFNNMPVELKKLLIDGSDKMKIEEIQVALKQYDTMNPNLKNLLIDNSDAVSKTDTALGKLNLYDMSHPETKLLNVDNSNAVDNVEYARERLGIYDTTNPNPKRLETVGDLTGVYDVENALNSVNDKDVNINVKTNYSADFIGPRLPGYKNGTTNHSGGPAILGDGKKNEPFLTPTGFIGISPNRDTLIPNLPKGTRVWPSIERFKSDMPKFKQTKAFSLMGQNYSNNKKETDGTTINNYDLNGFMNGANIELKDKYDTEQMMKDIAWAIKKESARLQ